ncbi:cyclin-dependent kinase 4 inhibitor B [Carassius gibelio]|uniref:cyclin-dependent kinase 4 inhibitor B n=1 Tax=Carassius gibelio TaxID=101364 RepID=UPI002277472B|nr:cyclin-dependent kinase 4 inhibitor B [Carassius gibelio]
MMKMMKMHDAEELTKAAATGSTERVRALLCTGASVNGVNRFGRTALQVMMMGNTAVARLLLEHGADPNVSDPGTGSTPLHDAARSGFTDTVRLLLRFEADPSAADHRGMRAVEVARHTGHLDVAQLLDSI